MKQYCYSGLFLLFALTAGLSPAQAQARKPRVQPKPAHTNLLAFNAPAVTVPAPVAPAEPAVAPTKVISGRVETTQGALPGAVVRLASLDQSCVTDAAGTFRFTVPASGGPLAAVVTYAGYADENVTLGAGPAPSVVQLTNPVDIKMGKQQQLKSYLKTARREVQHDLRQVK